MRRKSRSVKVGQLHIGSEHPIRLQSMTTSNTRDVEATVEQVRRLVDAGCDLVRMTVQGKKEAVACEAIKSRLVQLRCEVPLVADIHFYPPAAMLVADFVEKIRINPGNFCDFSRIEQKFFPLVEKCKTLGRAMRIGTNHGSLSERIMQMHGDSPRGMVESALEYAEFARQLDYHNFLFSMKSSNPKVMLAAYRLLVREMEARGWDYPLHLGVTEAGEGEDGRIKSAVGIGTLVQEGIGDTIRVSLTEDPWHELPPASQLANLPSGGQEAVVVRPKKRDERLHPDGTVIAPGSPDGDRLESVGAKQARFSEGAVVHVEKAEELAGLKPVIVIGRIDSLDEGRRIAKAAQCPVLWEPRVSGRVEQAALLGALLIDGLGEGIVVDDADFGFSLLQACRMRSTKTEFISCPSCGRTLFDLQSVSRQIRERTAHLPGVKIGIMGCIVNGPGEMADADFGYVGSKPGMIDLYVEKTCVERDIPMEEGCERLVELIKAHGRWVEKLETVAP